MAILVTGGAGFVGLNIAEQLLARGDAVVLFGPDRPPDEALDVLGRLPGRLSFAVGDVCEAADLDAALRTHRVDRLVHGAAITAGLERERHAAREILTVNLLGTVEVLEAAVRHGLRRLVLMGTGSIFGEAGQSGEWLDERDSPVLPESLYGIGKFAAERAAVRYRQTRGLDLSVARLGTVFGRWEYETGVRDSMSLPLQLLRAAERGEQVTVHSEAGDDWVYSVDVARGVLGLLDCLALPEPIYHLSAGMRWSIADWCDRLQKRFVDFRCVLSDRAEDCTIGRGKAARRAPMHIRRLQRDTGYQPAYLPAQAFDDYLAWRSRSSISGGR